MTGIITAISQIMFAVPTDPGLAVGEVDKDGQKLVDMYEYNTALYFDHNFYSTNHAYAWGPGASMLCCVLLILPSCYGYWQLGHKVSLGPF